MDIKKIIESLIQKACENLSYENKEVVCSFSNRPELCDFQCNYAMVNCKTLGKAPFDVAEEIINELNKEENDLFVFSAVRPGFINIKLTDTAFSKIANDLLNDENLGVQKNDVKRKIIIDYGGANVAKELHVGHLRSPIIGESLKRLCKLLGDEVISDVHLGDYGLQMGLTVLQLEEDGLLDFYFGKSDEKVEITLNMLNSAYPKASKRKKEDEEFRKKADLYTLYIQQKKEPYLTIYKEIRRKSVEQIKKNYEDLNATFDLWLGESDASEYTERTVKLFIDKGLTRESEGSLIVDVAREGEHIPIPKKSPDEVQRYENPMPPAIIKKYNGSDLYATTDIATILMRNENYNPDEIIYIVDSRQNQHFEQVFRCCKMAGISPENQKLTFIGFGTMNGKDGKPFKTRDGGLIKLEDIINLLKDKASEKLKSNGVEQDDDNMALKIGVAAMKFGDLSNNVLKDYVFDIDKFLSFEGKTGPYLQYTLCRIASIKRKIEAKASEIFIDNEEERKIIISLLKLISSYGICYKDKSLNLLCLSSYELASSFSTFYNNHKILTESDEKKRNSYLSLCDLVYKELALALKVLAIDIVDRM